MYNYQDSVSLENYFQQCYIAPLKIEIEKEDRYLDDRKKEALLSHLSEKNGIVELTVIAGDFEAFQFASEIRDFLKKEKYKIGEINQSVFSEPIKGQTIIPRKTGGTRIIIGKA